MQLELKNQAALSRGRNEIASLSNMYSTLCTKMCSADMQPAIPVMVDVVDGLSLTALGVKVVAKPRPIRFEGQFLYEFVFNGIMSDKIVEVWRFYLTTDGGLFETHDRRDGSRICDYNNEYVKPNVINQLLACLLDSALFAPAPTVQ